MHAHEVDYEIFGDDMQFVEVELDPGESVIAEAGAFMYQRGDIKMETIFGDPNKADDSILGKMFSAGKRWVSGENLFVTAFTAGSRRAKSQVAFAASYPGKIIPLNLAEYGTMHCQKNSFLCAAKGVKTDIALSRKIGSGLFGGEGFILQKLDGDGMAFVHAGGTIREFNLTGGEILKIDTGCVVAFQAKMDFDIEINRDIKSGLFGGEGFVFATLKGPGRCFLQSIPFSRLADTIFNAASLSKGGGGQHKGEGSILGGIATSMFQD
ncbi:TIGR00266 family protein [Candidatus Riflebacteria bacterium]